MLRSIICVTALLIVLGGSGLATAQNPQPGAEGLGDPLRPQAGNGGYDVESYNLSLTWVPATSTLSGSVRISAIATQDLSAFNLDFIGFEIDTLQVAALGNTDLADFSRAGQELTVTPTIMLIPIVDLYDVYEVYDTPAQTEPRTVVATVRGSKRLDGQNCRFGGILKELRFDDRTGKDHGIYLEAMFYTPLSSSR